MDYPFPSYKNPPLYEVSIGLQFQSLDRLKIPHFGQFWNRIQREFPIVEHAPPILGQSDEPRDLPLPRVWFIDKSDTMLLQLQIDRINFNWRFREKADPYPHFDFIAGKYFELLKAFEEFLNESNIGVILPTVTEVTYVNHFEHAREWNTMEDVDKLFKDFPWSREKDRFLPYPAKMSWAVSFPLPKEQGTLNARLSQALRLADNQQILQLEMVASHKVKNMPLQELGPWYELAHEWIVKGFSDMTQPEAQKKFWGREK